MKKINGMAFLTYVVFYIWVSILSALPIYDLQYTENPGNGTYPSNYENQIVNLSGIVTCNNYNGNKFVLSSPEGGPWNGILIYETGNFQLGDEVSLYGTVTEYYGLTEITDGYNLVLLSSDNPLPDATQIYTGELAADESYEGILVELNNVTIISAPDQYGHYMIDDGSGSCYVSGYCYPTEDYTFFPAPGMQLFSIKGIVTYSYNEYRLLPRYNSDLMFYYDQPVFSIEHIKTDVQEEIILPVHLYYTGENTTFHEFDLNIIYDPLSVQYIDYIDTGTLLEGHDTNIETQDDYIRISSESPLNISDHDIFFKLKFLPISPGTSAIVFSEVTINNEELTGNMNGSITFEPLPGIVADELTMIQKPILSVPEIVVAGNQMDILCSAPESTQYWQISLNWADIVYDLEVNNAVYTEANGLWTIAVTTPIPDIYTTYDLLVSAEYLPEDRAENAVYLIPEYKDNYYFVHITDSHLPGHTFYGNDPDGTDFSEIDDLRKVIDNVNLIKPEFVLFTGDIVNEGELEDFNGRFQYSRAKNLISEFDVPVFITNGNHDIGGWNETLPPPGSSRHNWHRFFGWEFLQNPPYGEGYTQNYHFFYDDIIFIGMEAYINYEDYLPGIFGNTSFTNWQLDWLLDTLNSTTASQRVLFYHYDFDNQINLNTMAIDLALYGHIHSNSGNINNHPYNLSTDAVCDGRRAFRVIKVNDNNVEPCHTCYAQPGISLDFSYPNSGLRNENSLTVTNPFDIDFQNCQIIFYMPLADNYQISYGSIEYVYHEQLRNQIAVRFFLPALEDIVIDIQTIHNSIATDEITKIEKLTLFPNPFNPLLNIQFTTAQHADTQVSVYNIKGQKVDTILNSFRDKGNHHLFWQPSKNFSSGIYFIALKSDNETQIRKALLIK